MDSVEPITSEAFEQMQGTVSFPFKPGEHKRIAVKVIDLRGNEVVRVVPLDEGLCGNGGVIDVSPSSSKFSGTVWSSSKKRAPLGGCSTWLRRQSGDTGW